MVKFRRRQHTPPPIAPAFTPKSLTMRKSLADRKIHWAGFSDAQFTLAFLLDSRTATAKKP
jgi:hypothetical protein